MLCVKAHLRKLSLNFFINEQMKSILVMFKKYKKSLNYFILIAIYFFFVNLEDRKEYINKLISGKDNVIPGNNSVFYNYFR